MSSYFDEASLVMIPSGYKNQKVYSVKPLDGSGDLTFSRASSATRVASNGLIEKVRTNVALYSQEFNNAAWSKTKATVTANDTTAPDGTLTADKVVFADGTSTIYQVYNLDGATATRSVYIKGTAGETISLDDVFVSQPLITLTGQWQRVSFTAAAPNTYGFGISTFGGATARTIWLWGAQTEVSDFGPTDYIATTSAAVSVGPVSGLPRLDYLNSTCPRLILEPQRSNKITYSENQNPTGTSWYPSTTWTVTTNTVTSPDGYTNADTLTETTSTGFHSGYYNAIIESSYTGTYTISAFVKYNGRLFVLNPFTTAGGRTYFNLQTGTVAQVGTGVTASIVNYGNGWYRCICTATYAAEQVGFEHMLASAVGTLQYTGNGTSGVHIWGCMAEAGAYATSYIPTLGTSVTRVADEASKTGISSLIGQTAGTFFYDGFYGSEVSEVYLFLQKNGSTGTNDSMYIQKDGSGIRLNIFNGSTQIVSIGGGTFSVGQRVKIAVAYANNDFAYYINGVQIGLDTTGTPPTCANMQLASYGGAPTTAIYQANKVTQTLLFPTRQTNAQLAELTTL